MIAAFVAFYQAPVHANPLGFANGAMTATATTSLKYMKPGTATTTFTYDAYGVNGSNQSNSGNTNAPTKLALALQFTGSSTPKNSAIATTTYKVSLEYSTDNKDWYGDAYTAFGTTTNAQNITLLTSRTFKLGTQTSKGVLIGSTTPTKVLIGIEAPTRYVRAVVTIPIGSTNGAVWGELLPEKELQ